MADSSPIPPLAKTCLGQFQRLVEVTERPGQQASFSISINEAIDILGRFRIWAGNIGALQRFELKSSLDYRIRDAPKVSTQIVELLDDLNDSLDDAISIISNARENRTSPAGLEADEAATELIAISGDDDSEDHDPGEEVSEIREIFKSIEDAINSLFRLSIIIRNNTNRDRFAKADSAALSSPFNIGFDIAHVRHKFPALEGRKCEWLIERLGKAITQRRQYLRYCRDHHDKISRVEAQEPVTVALITPKEPNAQLNLSPVARSAFSKPVSTLAPTQATTLILTSGQVTEEEEVPEDTQSQTSYATSTDDESGTSKLRVVQLEDVSLGSSHFECPYCWQIQNIRHQKAWKKHVLSDLKPYVCTFECCDLKLFSDPKTWFSHELMDHRKEFRCFFCTHPTFTDPVAYGKHLKSRHSTSYTEEQMPALLEMSQQPFSKFSPTDCPFCDDWGKRLREVNQHIPSSESLSVTSAQFQHHVASHFEQLALFAIPRGYTEEGEADSGNAAPQVGSDTTPRSEFNGSNEDSITPRNMAICKGLLDDIHSNPALSQRLTARPRIPPMTIWVEGRGKTKLPPPDLPMMTATGGYEDRDELKIDILLQIAASRAAEGMRTDGMDQEIEDLGELFHFHWPSRQWASLLLETMMIYERRIKWKLWHAKHIPPEQLHNLHSTKVLLKMPDGETVTRWFMPQETIESVYTYVECYELLAYVNSITMDMEAPDYDYNYHFVLRGSNQADLKALVQFAVRASEELRVEELGPRDPVVFISRPCRMVVKEGPLSQAISANDTNPTSSIPPEIVESNNTGKQAEDTETKETSTALVERTLSVGVISADYAGTLRFRKQPPYWCVVSAGNQTCTTRESREVDKPNWNETVVFKNPTWSGGQLPEVVVSYFHGEGTLIGRTTVSVYPIAVYLNINSAASWYPLDLSGTAAGQIHLKISWTSKRKQKLCPQN